MKAATLTHTKHKANREKENERTNECEIKIDSDALKWEFFDKQQNKPKFHCSDFYFFCFDRKKNVIWKSEKNNFFRNNNAQFKHAQLEENKWHGTIVSVKINLCTRKWKFKCSEIVGKKHGVESSCVCVRVCAFKSHKRNLNWIERRKSKEKYSQYTNHKAIHAHTHSRRHRRCCCFFMHTSFLCSTIEFSKLLKTLTRWSIFHSPPMSCTVYTHSHTLSHSHSHTQFNLFATNKNTSLFNQIMSVCYKL